MKVYKYLSTKLKPFQKKAVKKAYLFIKNSKTHSCYNASEMGTGKTVMAIEVLNLLRRLHGLKKTLIVSPACVEYNWKSELEEWLSDTLSISVLDSGRKYTEDNLKADVVITSYGLIRSNKFERARLLASKRFDNIIYDESHNLKSTKALQTKAAFYLWDCVKTRQALSGTPFLANIVDGYSLFHRMSPEDFPNFQSFVDNYSFKTVTPWAIKYFGVKRPKELRRIIRSKFYFRYTLDDSEVELPPVQWIRISLPEKYSVEKDIKEQIDRYEKELSKVLYSMNNDLAVPVTPVLAEHRRLQAEKAVKPILEFSANILEQGRQLVIFGWHKSVLRTYKEKLKKYDPGLIVGDTPLKLRDQYVKAFQEKRKQLLIINYVAGGFGLTLTSGNTVVAAELDWNPTTLAQAAGRFRRIGQKNTVNFYYFPTIKSIDERVISVVRSKASSFNKVM
jgi:SNF2 family DNA or RNA helicase